MKIGVLGANGFIGSHLVKDLSKDHVVVPVTRQTLDMLDFGQVKSFLEQQQFDIIIYSVAVEINNITIDDARNNLGIFMNFYGNRTLFKKFINLASGGEFDKSVDNFCTKETAIFDRMPKGSYGFSLNVKSRLCLETPHFYNLRIFNCFGSGEKSTRLFPRLLSCTDTFSISDNRYFDFFSIQDLCTVVRSFVDNDHQLKDVNCVYKEKYRVDEVVAKFIAIKNLKCNFAVTTDSENNYTGSHENLYSLNLELLGLEQGFKDYE